MITGRCLCGAVSWSARRGPTSVHFCHCSLCRRWTGAPFATLAWFARADIAWDGEPARFRSSPIAVRTHCAGCGTPLALVYDGSDEVAVTVGSMDEPHSVRPAHHYGAEGRLPWVDIGRELPAGPTRERWD
jgi:hypothetical protein